MKLAALLTASLLCAGAVQAQEAAIAPGSPQWVVTFDPPYAAPTEIPADSPLRRTLFDLLRPSIERVAKRPVQFQGHLRAFKNWALFVGSTVDKEGRAVKMPPTADNNDMVGLWLRTWEGWKLVDCRSGDSHDSWLAWTQQYGVPWALIHNQ